jgi:predicted aminopeptidase
MIGAMINFMHFYSVRNYGIRKCIPPLLLFLSLSTGCYYTRQGCNLIADQLRSKPIRRCLDDTTISERQRRFFNEIERIRTYATDSIGLVKNDNYTRFVQVDRSYLVAVLCAADSASFTTKNWCYPVLGCFPLRAYYDMHDAEKTGRRLADKGYEIHIDKVDGFSTLGIFSDPLYSFMAGYPVFILAQYILHEQTHATAYFRNVQFSEELATFIGREGSLDYMRRYYGADSEEYTTARKYIVDQQTFLRLLRKLYADLDNVYKTAWSRAEKIRKKREITGAFKVLLTDCYDSLFMTPWYWGAAKASYNNAYLALRMTYNLDLELFGALRYSKGGDLREVVRFARNAKKRSGDPKKLLLEELGSASPGK